MVIVPPMSNPPVRISHSYILKRNMMDNEGKCLFCFSIFNLTGFLLLRLG